MSRADEERESKLSRFRSEVRREPTDDEWSLLYATHAIERALWDDPNTRRLPRAHH